MHGPSRLWLSLRRNEDSGLVAAAVAVSVLFAATPFLLRQIAEEFNVSLGSAGLLSSAQVAGFALTTFVAGRTLRTHRRYLVVASLVAIGANLASVFAGSFVVLLAFRIVAGSAGGLMVWLAWAKAMRSSSAMRDVAVTGPLAVLIAAPVLAALAETYGTGAVFLAIALASVPPALLPADFAGFRPKRRRMSPSRSNVVLVAALGLIALSGSSLFVFSAAIGENELGMNPTVVSLGYSLNAFAGLFGARRQATDQPRAIWVLAIALSAAAVAFGNSPVVFVVGLGLWGFAFWVATPSILRAIAAWSLVPEERIGDAQSAMALGRAVGPAIAAILVGDGSFSALGVFAVGGLSVAGVTVAFVRRYRNTHDPPPGSGAEA